MTQDDEAAAIERAKIIIEMCGGPAEVAKIVGRVKQRVHSWTYPRDRHGTGGVIPAQVQLELLAHARSEGLPLTPEHFFPAASEGEAA